MEKARSLKKIRLLFIRKTIAFGGSEMVILDLLKGINYDENDVFLASPVDVFSNLLLDLKLAATWMPFTARFTGSFVLKFFSWIRYLVRVRPDRIILAEGGFRDFPAITVLAASAVARGNVWMMELHPAPEAPNGDSGSGLRRYKDFWSERVRERLPRGILAVSQGVKDRLVRGYGYAPENITVVYNGVDTERFSPASHDVRSELRSDLQIPAHAVVLVSSARLDGIKRLDRLLQAFEVLSSEHKDLWLLLTGEGPLREELMALAQSLANRNKIKFLGHVGDVCQVLQASDIYVLPSDEEGFGIALVEAMACELVCVVTRTIGPSEIIEDGLNGFLTDITYEGVLGGLRVALRQSPEERDAMRTRARRRVIENFQVEKSVSKGLAYMEISRATEAVR